MRKKLLHILLAAIILVNLLPIGIAYAQPKSAVEICEILGILKGDETGLSEEYLSKSTERIQAVILTLRLAGKGYEEIALDYESDDNFTDIEQLSWIQGRNILAYIKDNPQFGWKGNPDGSFNPRGKVTYQMIYKVLLEALGYTQDYGEGGDFKWEEVKDFAFSIGLWDIMGIEEVTNRDMAVAIVEALQLRMKDSDITLLEKLVNDGAIDRNKAYETGLLKEEAVIVSVEEIDLGNISDEEEIVLPKTVKARYSDSTEKEVSVEWDFDPNAIVEGNNTIVGDVEGTDIMTFATFNYTITPLRVMSVEADNLIQIYIKFNKAVEASRAMNPKNYVVSVGEDVREIEKITLADEGKMIVLLFNTPFKSQQNVNVTVKKEIGLSRNYDTTIQSIIDRYIPKVESIEAFGNKLIRVKFSEPVRFASNSSNYTLDGKVISTSGIKVVNESTVDINLSKRLESGTYELGIKSGIVDYAGFKVMSDPIKFTVKEDTVELDIEEIISVTQTKLELMFTKPVEPITKEQIMARPGSIVTSVECAEDMRTYTIEFERTAAIRAEGAEIGFYSVVDFYGNRATIKVNVVPTLDVDIPEFVNYEVKDQDKIIIEFSEDVLPTGASYILENIYGTPVSLSQLGWYTDGTGKTYRNKVVLQRPGGVPFEAGTYVLTIKDVVDYTPQENRILPLSIEIRIVDDISPEVNFVRRKDNQLFISFSEAVDPATALSRNSYRYLDLKSYASNAFPEDTGYELIAGGKTVVITLPEYFDVKVIDVLQISLVTDLAGNVMEGKGFPAPFATIDSSPKINSAYVTGKNTIVLNMNKEINPDTLTAEDFLLTAGDNILNISEISYDEENRRIIITVEELISSNGQYAGRDIYVATASDEPITSDIYGQPIQPIANPIKAIDKYPPYATGFIAVNNGENTDIIISLNENIKTTHGSGKPLVNNDSELTQFIVLADNVVAPVIASRYEDATSTSTARIILTISGNKANSSIRVMFFAGPNNALKDNSSSANPLANFELP